MKNPVWTALALQLVCGAVFAQDIEGPEIVSIGIAPASVDVTSGDQGLVVTLNVTDSESGFAYANLFLRNSSGDFVTNLFFTSGDVLPGGDSSDGTYEVPASIPEYAAPGIWSIEASLVDNDGNTRSYDSFGESLPVPEDAEFEVVNTSGTVDVDAPLVVSFSASESAVDVTTASAAIDFNIELTDDLSGLRYAFVEVLDPSGNYRGEYSQFFDTGSVIPPGDGLDGSYLVTVTLPAGVASGEWKFSVSGRDRVGNFFSSDQEIVAVSGAVQGVRFLAKAVDTVPLLPTNLGVPWQFQTDETYDGIDAAASGPVGNGGESALQLAFEGPGTVYFQWNVDSEEGSDFLSVEVDGLVVGTPISGSPGWSGESVSIPPGPHLVMWRYIKDGSGAGGADRAYLDQVRFEGDFDSDAPRVRALRIDPRLVDVSEGPVEVTFEMEITDDYEGFSDGSLTLYSSSGSVVGGTSFDDNDNIEGDAYFGIYSVTVEVPDDEDFGLWRTELTVTDQDSNSRTYGEGYDDFPCAGEENFFVASDGGDDEEAPLIRDLEVVSPAVDISGGDATAVVMIRITDLPSGFSSGNISVYDPEVNFTGSHFFNGFSRIAGDEYDGIYRVEIDVPEYGTPGLWRVDCYVADGEGNAVDYPDFAAFPDHVDPTFLVVNDGTVDSEKPFVSELTVAPLSVNTDAGPAALDVTIVAGDSLSGLKDAYLYFYDPGGIFQSGLFTDLQSGFLTEGDEFDGTYHVTKMLPQGSETGQWSVRLFLRDRSGKSGFFGGGSDPLPNPSDGLFTVTSGAPSLFQAFVDAASLAGEDALHGADPDKDGRNNATELMLGTGPDDAADAGTGLIVLSRDAGFIHLDFTVDPALNAALNGDFLELDDGGGGAPLRLTGQTQSGLGSTWADVAPVQTGGSTWRVSLAITPGGSGFIRLYFEEP